jgi:tetratricopeptide (TPR) repeat protein
MTDKKHASNPNPSENVRHSSFLRQCLAGVAAIAVAGVFLHLAEPQAAVEAEDSQAAAAKTVTFEELLRFAQRQTVATGRTGNYLAGRYAANIGDFESADVFLTRTMKQDPKNLEIAGYTYRMRLITGDMDGAAEMAERLYNAGDVESNPEVMLLLKHLKAGEYAETREVLTSFRKEGFNLIVLPLVTAWVDYAQGTLVEPFERDDLIRQVGEFAPFIYYQSAIVNDMAGFEDKALEQYQESLALSKVMPYRVVEMMGNLYARRGEFDKAEELYARYREQNPDSLLLPEGEQALAKEHKAPARLVKSPREGVAEIFFSTASILHNESLDEEALIYIQQVLYLNPEFTAAKLMRGTIYEELGQYDDAIAAYDSLPEGTTYYQKGQLRKAYTLNTMGQSEKALKLLDSVADAMPSNYQVQLTRGDILMRLKRFDDAAAAYSLALEHVETASADHWPIYYARGISYERSGQWQLAEADFLKALEIEPAQPDVLNYLGYSWLEKGMRVDDARRMIEQAVQARPTDAHIVDSMGWALYALGDYEGAIEYLERAIELMPTDPTVNDHLGDVYWRLGRKTEARFQWKRALLFKPEAEHAEKLTQKLADGLPPANQLQTAENEKKLQQVEVRQN